MNCRRYIVELLLIRLKTPNKQYYTHIFRPKRLSLATPLLTIFRPQNFSLVNLNFKTIAYDIFSVAQMRQFFLGSKENIVEKGENAGNQHFPLFPLCFQDTIFSRIDENLYGTVKGKWAETVNSVSSFTYDTTWSVHRVMTSTGQKCRLFHQDFVHYERKKINHIYFAMQSPHYSSPLPATPTILIG